MTLYEYFQKQIFVNGNPVYKKTTKFMQKKAGLDSY